ncbi:MAG: hypothetical protein WKF67_12895, partial [Rubrobacteraceae bacterium]
TGPGRYLSARMLTSTTLPAGFLFGFDPSSVPFSGTPLFAAFPAAVSAVISGAEVVSSTVASVVMVPAAEASFPFDARDDCEEPLSGELSSGGEPQEVASRNTTVRSSRRDLAGFMGCPFWGEAFARGTGGGDKRIRACAPAALRMLEKA